MHIILGNQSASGSVLNEDGWRSKRDKSSGGRNHERDKKFCAGLDPWGGLCGGDFAGGWCACAGAGGKANGFRGGRFSLAGQLEGGADVGSDQYEWGDRSEQGFRRWR